MARLKGWVLALGSLLLCTGGSMAETADLSLEQRIEAEEIIARVYDSHRIGAVRTSDVVTRNSPAEARVRDYLKRSRLLETRWGHSISDSDLTREVERMIEGTRMPERLSELFAALGNDPLWIRECLARPLLSARLARSFFASDQRIHARNRREAEALRQDVLGGRVDPSRHHERRTVVEVARNIDGVEAGTVALDSEDFLRVRASLPRSFGEVGPLAEESDAFVFRVLLDQDSSRLRYARFEVPKVTWDDWWGAEPFVQDESQVLPTASSGAIRLGSGRRDNDTISASSSLASCPPGNWDNHSLDLFPEGRLRHTAVWTGTHMIVWGGLSGSKSLSDGGRYDPATDTWASVSTQGAPEARSSHTAVWTGTVMIVWGGETNGHPDGTGAVYDPIQDSWTPMSSANVPAARSSHTAVWTGDRMIVWGGWGSQSHLANGALYDPAADAWSTMSDSGAPEARSSHTAVWTGSLMVVWGGFGLSGDLDSGGRYEPANNSWTPTSTVGAPSLRRGHVAVWTGSRMIAWGGARHLYEIVTDLDTGGTYDPEEDRWKPMSTVNAPSGREEPKAVWTGGLMVVWGGTDNAADGSGNVTRLATGGRYDPIEDEWTPTASENAPSARAFHSVAWTGQHAIFWGGLGSGTTNTGGRYDPASDVWTPTSTSNSRRSHTAVWTGNLMIVWGGSVDGSSRSNTGSRYDPVTDDWTPTSLAGAPTARAAHSAVWTGSHMIVWGGADGSGVLPVTGGRYDPSGDSWTPTSTTDVPEGRSEHRAVWSGNVMIVWGGKRGGQATNTGGRYDPVLDAWQPTSVLNAPSERTRHTAIWTGALMIVWGSDGLFSSSNTGACYDPVMDTWSPTSLVNAPSPRERHVAIWTGSRMIVWGGGGLAASTGGLYEPTTDTWAPTSLVNAPSSRYGHSGVWTGARMIVWGGWRSPDGYLDSGGEYDPWADSWTPMSTVDAPSARQDHTAVWSGDAMLVWGGLGSGLPAGGRYVHLGSSDQDGDGLSQCSGDCDDQDPGIVQAPRTVRDVRVERDPLTAIHFESQDGVAGAATSYDVVKGLVSELRSSEYADATCLGTFPDTPAADAGPNPPPEEAWYYLVRARNACPESGTGSYGDSGLDPDPRDVLDAQGPCP